MDKDFKWKSPEDGFTVPEVVDWLKSLEHENLVDLWMMLNTEMNSRGMPGHPIAGHPLIERIKELPELEDLSRDLMGFCRPS